jgi:hypothetical protein
MINKMPKRQKQDKYTKSAKGQDCQIRSPACNHNPETVVFCHLNGAGIGEKMQNIHGAYGCLNCHDFVDGMLFIDGMRGQDFNTAQRQFYHLKGTIRTQELMIRNGILKL